jgi:hypothetical protein
MAIVSYIIILAVAGHWPLAAGDWLFLNVRRIGFARSQGPEASSQGLDIRNRRVPSFANQILATI